MTAARGLPLGRARSPRRSRAARQAPGVVKVRLSGDRADIESIAAMLAGACEVLDRSRARPNDYDPGERVYLTIRTDPVRRAT